MLVDYNLVLGDAQAVTVTAPSTNVVDQLAKGDAQYMGAQFQALVDTAFTAGGAATLTIALQDSADNSSFADVLVSPAIAVASLIAGYVAFQGTIPMGVRRYLRINYTVATGPMTAGKIDSRILLAQDKTLDKIL